MQVEQVVRLARDWVENYSSQTPGFCGAYLTGGISTLSPDAPFPLYRDVDLIVVLEEGARSWVLARCDCEKQRALSYLEALG